MSAAADDRRDPAVINELLIAFHEKLGDQWNAETEAEQFITHMQVTHPEAFNAWVEAHIVDLVVRFLRDLERRHRDAARQLRKKDLNQLRAREYLRAEHRREAEARGEEYDEDEDIDAEAEKIRSIFELVVNTTDEGVTKRIGAWTFADMTGIANNYSRVGMGFLRQGQTVQRLAQSFETKRQTLLKAAMVAGNTADAQRYSDPELTVADILTESEVTQIWVVDEDDSEAQATNP